MKSIVKFAMALVAVAAGLVLFVEALAYLAWALSGAGKIPLESLDAIPVPQRSPVEPRALHRLSEWPADRPREFRQAPALDEAVRAGRLPPVAARLPADPLVITPPEQMGPYGGTWARLANSPQDMAIFESRLCYEHPLRWDPMGRRVQPNMVVRWEVADGGRTYTLWLRRGVRWSDGEPFGADDILFWYEHVILNKELNPVVQRDLVRGGEPVRIEKVDDSTVRFRFKEPHGLFPQKLATEMWAASMMNHPAHYLKQFHPDFTPKDELVRQARAKQFDFWFQLFQDRNDWRTPDAPRLWAWTLKVPLPAQTVVFERNPFYWKVDAEGRQLPYIDAVTFQIFDAEVINQKAIAGELGMQDRHLQFENYPLFMQNRRKARYPYRVLHWIDGGGGRTAVGLNLNHKDPVMRGIIEEPKFRMALSYAINRAEINEIVYFGVGRPRQMAPPPASPFYSPEYERAYVEYDPAKANRLLDEIGLGRRDADGNRLRPDGQTLTLSLETTTWTSLGELELVAEYWRGVGLKAEMRNIARPLFYTRKLALLHDAGAWSAGDEQYPIMDPRWFLPFSPESIHAIGYARNFQSGGRQGEAPTGDLGRCVELYRQIEQTADEAEQLRLFREIVELNRRNLWVLGTVGQVPWICLAQERFRNVPEVAVYGWIFRTPGNTAPECYAIQED